MTFFGIQNVKQKCAWLGVLSAAVVTVNGARAQGANALVEPVVTRYAATYEKIVVDVEGRYFDDLRVQEMDQFDGSSVSLSLKIPFKKRFQFEALLPVYTYGHADLIDSGRKVRVSGGGLVFDYPAVFLAHQVLSEAENGLNGAYYLGAAALIGKWGQLNVDKGVMNHQGRMFQGGLRADKSFGSWQVAGNLGGRYYWESDDLNPGGSSDSFALAEASGALVYHPGDFFAHPALEVNYRGDLATYNPIWLVPQVLIPICSNSGLKIGVPFRVTNDGERFGVNAHLVFQF